jgi:hypothetical protein
MTEEEKKGNHGNNLCLVQLAKEQPGLEGIGHD